MLEHLAQAGAFASGRWLLADDWPLAGEAHSAVGGRQSQEIVALRRTLVEVDMRPHDEEDGGTFDDERGWKKVRRLVAEFRT